jgi:hypothetical protein
MRLSIHKLETMMIVIACTGLKDQVRKRNSVAGQRVSGMAPTGVGGVSVFKRKKRIGKEPFWPLLPTIWASDW